MLIPSLIALTIAIIAVYTSFKTAEEIEVVTAVLTALICLLISIICSPVILKVPLVAALLIGGQSLASILGWYILSSAE
ncbi:hypothetical protein [Limnofasciculus baicalensis]|uniref:Uncharacterized protein n=1 Tax=Limnofasciculus baicalensis BBK-W-15 TaxID=2699891 RepID=A0AAE3GPW6_9CYAN|nr:hypothetical protein [Limnofasciculus baicalensis]MCP2728561.1 hypothetical protein [Limnofasciculus baicalensis BBK-W-15]